jgi:hypothetical protein
MNLDPGCPQPPQTVYNKFKEKSKISKNLGWGDQREKISGERAVSVRQMAGECKNPNEKP